MIIHKSEPKQVIDRQCSFFSQVVPERKIIKNSSKSYSYTYIAGVNASSLLHVISYLKEYVWIHPPLICDTTEYYWDYLTGIAQTHPRVLSLLKELSTEQILVHGDATLENFIQTFDGVTCIDPGMSRGFCHRENDKGKLLQSYLTHWQTIRHGLPPIEYRELPACLSVNNGSIASLISHWYRIIKNHERHPSIVRRYGLNCVIPVLTAELQTTNSSVGYRWMPDRLRKIYNLLLPKSLE